MSRFENFSAPKIVNIVTLQSRAELLGAPCTGAHHKDVRQHSVTEVRQEHVRAAGGDDAGVGRARGDGVAEAGDD